MLLVDYESRIFSDCFLDSMSEMELSRQAVILQYDPNMTNVANSFEHDLPSSTDWSLQPPNMPLRMMMQHPSLAYNCRPFLRVFLSD